jgi:lipopolysaccharide/colanic/teichoic acid biosynthesis glycosyltransferase
MKRVFDCFVAATLLIVLSPILVVLWISVLIFMGSPALFVQKRPGLHGRPFRLLKFRTMRAAVNPAGSDLPDSHRLTWFGRFLRTTSLDELPELWNIIRGDMSLVGPRPLLMEYLPLYTEEQTRRHEVRPGLTGWAQINGRNAISWEERFRLDVWYVDHQSFWLDVKILFMTVLKVIRREGISGAGEATMARFAGTEIKRKINE